MIPGRIVRFLHERANVAFAGTRSRDLVPHSHRVCGWRVEPDLRTLAAFVPDLFTPHLVESLADNGQIAVTIEEFPAHETYQFKGRYLRHRPVQDDDARIVDRIRDRFVRSVRPIYADVSEQVLRAFVPDAHVAVELSVREIFVQTPGPAAGSRVVPPAAPAP